MSHNHSRSRLLHTGVVLIGATALVVGGASAAQAHVGIAEEHVEAGSYSILTFGVPHGCDGSATTEVAIQIPEGINSITPTRNAHYTVQKVTEALDTPIADSHGNEVTERVSQVVYTAVTPLPDDQRDAFELSLQLPEDSAGETVYFPTVQTCEEGETAWVQIPEEGQDPHDLDAPAPSIDVVAATSDAHVADGATDGNDAGTGPMPLVITSLIVGSGGLLLGLAALLRGRRRA